METSYSIGRVLLLTYLFLMSPYTSNLFSTASKNFNAESCSLFNLKFFDLILSSASILSLFLTHLLGASLNIP